MALKFLNKKGWHTGSLRNIENVWKAEQKHDAEQKKLEELRKQIHEERERSEFRQLQEQAGLVPRQERLEFLYDSGLAVGKTSEGGSFKALEAATPKPSADAAAESSSKQAAAAAPGALFEEKPQSANDTWRKLHSDPLLMIRQREQEALARVKNNPVQMAMIRKSIESKSKKEKDKDGDKKERKAKGRDKKEHKSHDKRERREKRHHTSSKHQKHSSSRLQSDSDNDTDEDIKGRKSGNRTEDYDKHYHKRHADSGSELSERDGRSNKSQYKRLKDEEQSPKGRSDSRTRKDDDDHDALRKNHDKSKHDRYSSRDRIDIDDSGKERENKRFPDSRSHNSSATGLQHEARRKQRYVAPKLSEEERAARLREMQMDAEVHEEQRWKRLKKAEDDDAREASLAKVSSGGRNFLDAAHRSVYGAEKGGSSTIEESVRRRTHYRQGRSEASEGNAFRR